MDPSLHQISVKFVSGVLLARGEESLWRTGGGREGRVTGLHWKPGGFRRIPRSQKEREREREREE